MFGGDEIVVVALESELPFSAQALDFGRDLASRLEEIGGVARVDSLSTLPVIEVRGGEDLFLGPALGSGSPMSEAAHARLKNIAASDRILPRTLVSGDGRTTALSLVLEASAGEQQDRILREIDSRLGEHPALISGVPVFRVEANRRTGAEVTAFAGATALILAGYLLTMFRSAKAALYGLAPGVLGASIVMAQLGWDGVPLSISTMILPSMLIALGCAYAMHLLVACSDEETAAGIVRKLRPLVKPLWLSGVTTAIGLVSLRLVGIDAVVHVGTYGAAGVLAITAIALSLLPALLRLGPIRRPRVGRNWNFEKLVGFVDRRRAELALIWIVVTVVCGIGLSRVEVETDATRWFGDHHPVRQDYVAIRDRLSGISPMNVVIEVPPGESVLERDVLARVDELSDLLEGRLDVGKAISIADPLRQIHGGFSSDPILPLPEDRVSAEQYLLLLESVESIGDLVTDDRQATNILLRVDDNGSGDLLALARFIEEWWRENGPPRSVARATGIMFEFARAEDALAYGQLYGLGLALISISVILFLVLGSYPLAAAALIPNALPLVIIFGLMGLAKMPLDAGTVFLAVLALGVAVDDTIHLMTSIVRAFGQGSSARQALHHAYGVALPAVVSSTLLVSLSFGVFVLSDFTLTRNLGWLTSGVMVICLLADVFLLGPLILGIAERGWGMSQAVGSRRSDGRSGSARSSA